MKTHEHILLYTFLLPFLPVLNILLPSSVIFFILLLDKPYFYNYRIFR